MSSKSFFDGPHTPLVVDRKFDMFFIVLWSIYATWALVSSIEEIPSFSMLAVPISQFIWGGLLGTVSFMATIFSIMTFFPSGLSRVGKEKLELLSVIMIGGFIAVYPCVIAYNIVVFDNWNALAGFVLSLSYMLAPVYRAVHLWGRIKQRV